MRKFYEIIYDGEPSGELQTEKDLREEFEEAKKTGNDYGDETLEAYIEDQIVNGEIEEVFLSTEEMENLLTETQNQITLETYAPYGMEEDDDKADGEVLYFTIPYSWYLDYLEKYYTIDDLNEFHTPEENEDLDTAFLQEYTWDMTIEMYEQADLEKVVIKKEFRED